MKTAHRFILVIAFLVMGASGHEAWAGLFRSEPDSIRLFYEEATLRLPGESFRIGVDMEETSAFTSLTMRGVLNS